MTPYLASLIRHAGTVAGGYLMAKGQPELGGLVTTIFAAWSIHDKRSAKKKLARAATVARAQIL